ncbi:hypothetical protein D5085_03320 [Ectothiorhodospiraceae bacterium BW-2]|nr:hypothetical protein D5085_03320 [Ectothiorhodospiraceae bacterium BW-2]
MNRWWLVPGALIGQTLIHCSRYHNYTPDSELRHKSSPASTRLTASGMSEQEARQVLGLLQ